MDEFNEHEAERAEQFSREKALNQVIAEYLGADEGFLSGYDLEERIGVVSMMLLELNEDPEMIFTETGVFAKENDDEV